MQTVEKLRILRKHVATAESGSQEIKKPAKSLTKRAVLIVAEEGFEPPTQGL
jgi:hypothetical protein